MFALGFHAHPVAAFMLGTVQGGVGSGHQRTSSHAILCQYGDTNTDGNRQAFADQIKPRLCDCLPQAFGTVRGGGKVAFWQE